MRQNLNDIEGGEILSKNNNNADICCSNVLCWMKSYFWDVNINKLDVTKNRNYSITRLLSFGDQYTLKWAFDTYERDVILYVVKNSRDLLLKTVLFWKSYFNLNESEIRCFKVFEDIKDIYSF